MCPITTHCVDMARMPCKQCIVFGALDFSYDSTFLPFEYIENAESAGDFSSNNWQKKQNTIFLNWTQRIQRLNTD